MDNSELIKRIDSLEKENRLQKDLNEKTNLEVVNFQKELKSSVKKTKELTSELTQLKILVSKVDDFSRMLSDYKTEINKGMDVQDKRITRTEKDLKKNRDFEIDRLNKQFDMLRSEVESSTANGKKVPNLSDKITKFGKNMNELTTKVETLIQNEGDARRIVSETQVFRQSNDKKHNEFIVQLDALQFHVDELRGKAQLGNDNIKKNEMRLNEISSSEIERRENQDRFMEKINLMMLDQEKSIVELENLLKEIEKIKATFAEQVQEVELSIKLTDSSRNQYRDLIDKLDRRINEITEIQRIGEDRFRQEWSSYKAEDQKRWSNYLLSQDERQNERTRKVDKLIDKHDGIEEGFMALKDKVGAMSELSEKRLQSLLNISRDWVADNVRAIDD